MIRNVMLKYVLNSQNMLSMLYLLLEYDHRLCPLNIYNLYKILHVIFTKQGLYDNILLFIINIKCLLIIT